MKRDDETEEEYHARMTAEGYILVPGIPPNAARDIIIYPNEDRANTKLHPNALASMQNFMKRFEKPHYVKEFNIKELEDKIKEESKDKK